MTTVNGTYAEKIQYDLLTDTARAEYDGCRRMAVMMSVEALAVVVLEIPVTFGTLHQAACAHELADRVIKLREAMDNMKELADGSA